MIHASELHTNPVMKQPLIEVTSTKSPKNVFGRGVGALDRGVIIYRISILTRFMGVTKETT